MKKIFALFVALMAMTGVAMAQEGVYEMKVTKANGLTTTFEVGDEDNPESMKRVKFTNKIPDEWTSLGYCLYGEDVIASLMYFEDWSMMCVDYYVEVQENDYAPGLYRLVNPYAPGTYPYYTYATYDDSKDYYVVIDATDPDYVFIDLQETGISYDDWFWGWFGEMYIWSQASLDELNGFTKEQVQEWEECGKMEDGVITFPYDVVLSKWDYGFDDTVWYGNCNGMFKLDLNDKADAPGVKQ